MATDQWVTMERAQQVLALSERSIQRLVQQGSLRQRREQVDGQATRLYSASDLARIKQEGTSAAGVPALRLPAPSWLRAALPASEDGESEPAANLLWLSIEQAAEVSGLAPSFLLGLIHEGEITAVKGGPNGSWRIRRKSLEEYAG